MVSRMGASMLDALGLNELITDNHQAYIDLVLKIAANKIYRDEQSKSLVNSLQRKQINAQLLTASFERELVRMYQQKLSQNT